MAHRPLLAPLAAAFLSAAALVGTLSSTGLAAGPIRVVESARIGRVGAWKVDLRPGDDAQPVIDQLPRNLAVLALQGVYLDEDEATPDAAVDTLKELAAKVKRFYRYAYWAPRQQTHDVGCQAATPQEVCSAVLGVNSTDCAAFVGSTVLACLASQGAAFPKIDTESSLSTSCGAYTAALLVIDPQCAPCVLNAAAENGGNAQGAFDACVAQQGPRYAFGGSTGQVILSKVKIRDLEEVGFESFSRRRANLYATIRRVRYGFADFPDDFAPGGLGFPGFVPPPAQDMQPVLAADMIASSAGVLMGSFASGTGYKADAYDAIKTKFDDAAPGVVTQCTPPMITAGQPPCFDQFGGGTQVLPSYAADHVFLRTGKMVCGREPSAADPLFADPNVLTAHAGLLACQ